MARKKAAPVEEGPKKEEEVPFGEDVKWNEPSGGTISQDTVGHLMKAATEFLGAMDTMMPKKKMPDEVRVHYRAAKKEMLLMARAILDAKIAECDTERSTPEEEPRVRKINLE
jgi:hypothetical protein